MYRGLKNHSGFTLLELMIVVGIVGILTTVAKANFDRSAARARTVEAKIALGSLYTLEQSFWMEAGTYSGCIRNIGYGFGNGTRTYYSVGFNNALTGSTCLPDDGTGQPATCLAWPVNSANECLGTNFFIRATNSVNGAVPPPDAGVMTAQLGNAPDGLSRIRMSGTTFMVGAVGNVERGSAAFSAFTIDQNKQLLQVR